MDTLREKVAIVTGGERGIGRAIALDLLEHGMRVCIAGIDEESAQATLAGANAGERLHFIKTDVGREADVREMVAGVRKAFGQIDAVVANAGLPDASGQDPETLSLEEWDKVIRTNLTGCFLCAKHSFPELRRRKGTMVLIASTRALQSEPDTVAYAASKGGILSLTHSLAMSGGPEIRVNAISPGWIHHGDPGKLRDIDHSQHPVGRAGRESDIASMARFLVSGDSAFITGQNHVVDGGMTRRMIYAH